MTEQAREQRRKEALDRACAQWLADNRADGTLMKQLIDAIGDLMVDAFLAGARCRNHGYSRCPDCGDGVDVDEDGCCLVCGRDAIMGDDDL